MRHNRLFLFLIASGLATGMAIAQYAGTYTIDPNAQKFRSFREVADSLNLYGVSGPCVFEAVGGTTYTGQTTLTNVAGSGSYSITFRPKPGEIVFIDASGAQQGFKISGTHNVILEGLRIGKATADGVLFENCNGGTVRRCSIFGTTSGQPSNGIELNNSRNIELVSTYVTKTGGNQGIYIYNNSSGARVRGCNVSGTSNYSLYIGAADVIVESTTVSCTGGSGGIGTGTSATGCVIRGCFVNSSSGYGINVLPAGITIESTAVTMTGGSAGIYFAAGADNGLVWRGTVAGNSSYGVQCRAKNVTVEEVTVTGGTSGGVFLEQTTGAGSRVRNCKISSSSTNGGVYLDNNVVRAVVENCEVTMTGGGAGIYLRNADTCRIEGCTVNGNSTAGIRVYYYCDDVLVIGNRLMTTGACGIQMLSYTGNGRGKRNQVYNNFVYGFTDTAISVRYQENLGLYYNTLVGSSSSNYRYGIFCYEGVNVTAKNNIIWNKGTGSSYCYNLQSSSSFVESNHNDLYCPSGYVARINTVDYRTLTDWQQTGNDGASISVDPGIVGVPDLHLAAGSLCIGKGVSLAPDITRDIDGHLRKTGSPPEGPDIGADEYVSAPGAVTLLSPVNGSRNILPAGTLAWTGGTNADSFRVYLGTDYPPSLYQGNVSGSPFSYTGLTPGALYHWFVLAKNSAGVTSSDTWGFRVALAAPNLLLPTAGEKNVPAEGNLFWSAGGGATKWSVFLGMNSMPESVPIEPVTNNTYQYAGLVPGGRYYWTVAAKDDYGQRTASNEVRDFYVRLGAPVQLYPPDDTVDIPLSGTLVWSGGAGANSWTVFFGMNPDQPDSVADVSVPEYTYTALPGQKYYWTVAAKDKDVPGQRTLAGKIYSFSTLAKPGVFSLSYPAHGARGVPLAVIMQWERAERAESYDVYLDTKNPPEFKTTVSAESYSPPELLPNTDYYWKIVARNAAGETENTGGIQTFRTVLTEAPVLQTPPDGDTVKAPQQHRPEFSWSALGPPVSGYDIQLDDNDDFQSPEYIVTGIGTNRWIPQEPGLEEGRWFWRVRGDNGAPGPWCDSVFSVFVDLTPPSRPVLVRPVGGVKVNTLRPLLEWEGTDDTRRFRLTVRSGAEVVLERDIEQPENTRRTSYQLESTEELEDGRTYTWTVEAFDYAGNTAGPADEGVFEIELDNYDAGVTAILAPTGDVVTNTPVHPRVVVANFGNRAIQPYVRVTITGPTIEGWSVAEQVDKVIPAGGEPLTYEFAASWTASLPGNYVVRCSTELAGDSRSDNDRLIKGFRVVSASLVHDVGVKAIVEPSARVLLGQTQFPVVVAGNYGQVSEPEVPVRVTITGPNDEIVYDEVKTVSLAVGEEKGVLFGRGWVPDKPGLYNLVSQTELATDTRPENDRKLRNCNVVEQLWPEGWDDVSSMPELPTRARLPKDGAWLVAGPDKDRSGTVIYAAKGNKTSDFYKYYPERDSWVILSPIPELEPALGKPKPVSKGSRAVSDGREYLYMVKGGGTQGFWRYRVEEGKWETLPRVPQKIKGGNDLVYVERNGRKYIYLLAGGKTAFYRYDVDLRQWTTLESAPYGNFRKKYARGSFLVYDQSHSIYAHQAAEIGGNGYHYMFRYDLARDSWNPNPLKGIPVWGIEDGKEKRKKSKDGAGGVWCDGRIYAVKGGGSQTFFRYSPEGDSWSILDTIPRTGSGGKKTVKAGGSLVNWKDRAMFLLKGNKTYEFWRYVEPKHQPAGLLLPVSGIQAQLPTRTAVVHLTPNPLVEGFATLRVSGLKNSGLQGANLRIFDALGRCVLVRDLVFGNWEAGTLLDLRHLSAGVYVVRLETGNLHLAHKLVIKK